MKTHRIYSGFSATLFAFAAVTHVTAQAIVDPTKPPPPAGPAKPAEGAPSPFNFTASYTADLLSVVSGGRSGGVGYVDLAKLSAAYDGAGAGQEGLTGLVSLEHANGSDFTARHVGGVQSVSALEAQPEAFRLYEAWLQKDILNGQGGVKLGLIDINTTYDVQETAALFINASEGIGPDVSDTGLNGPSDYPTPALAVTSFYRPAEGWTVQLGIFDGAAGDPSHRNDFVAVKLEGALLIGQLEKRFGDVARIETGAWSYTAAFPSLDQINAAGAARAVHGNDGLYGLIEGRLMAKPGVGGGDSQGGGLSGWLRVGFANGDINPIEKYVGGGLVYTGLIPGRDKDEIGFAVARSELGRGAHSAGLAKGRDIGGGETDMEAIYRYAFKEWLNIQPDVQYVIDPHADRQIPDALVVGVRLAFTYSK